MKVLLLKAVKNLGRVGEIKEVSEGYARNFLFAGKLAEGVSNNTLKLLEAQKSKKERIKKQTIKDKNKLALKINNKNFTIGAKGDSKGTLYAGLDSKTIAEFLTANRYNINSSEIYLEEPIKKVGDYKIRLVLAGKNATILLTVAGI